MTKSISPTPLIPPSLVEAEMRRRGTHVVASVVRRRATDPLTISVCVVGIVCRVRVRNPESVPTGIGIFELLDVTTATYLRPASAQECRIWFDTLPKVRRLLLWRVDEVSWMTAPAAPAARTGAAGGHHTVPVYTAPVSSNGAMFDEIVARYDGIRLWDDGRALPGNADRALLLRERAGMTPPCPEPERSILGLTPYERAAYATIVQRTSHSDRYHDTSSTLEQRVFADIRRAGGDPIALLDHGDTAEIVYTLNGQQFRHLINRETLFLVSSGICLDGQDHRFDVVAAVRVMAEYLQREHR